MSFVCGEYFHRFLVGFGTTRVVVECAGVVCVAFFISWATWRRGIVLSVNSVNHVRLHHFCFQVSFSSKGVSFSDVIILFLSLCESVDFI